MTKLNEIIAVEKGEKSRHHEVISAWYKDIQKSELFTGFARNYFPIDDAGDHLPSETKKVQKTVSNIIKDVEKQMNRVMNIVARKEWTNTHAKSDIIVDGTTLAVNVPVTYLLFLEKELLNLHTFISKLPVLDPAEDWDYDDSKGYFKTAEIKTHRTKKVPRPLVKYPHSEHHPAQTEVYNDDVVVGYWHNVKHSGAMKQDDKNRILERVEKLQIAVKEARERANNIAEEQPHLVGAFLLNFVFG